MKVGGSWPITNCDLANKCTELFQKFVNTTNFETLYTEHLTVYFYKQKAYIRTLCKRNFSNKT
jgi:hypothetical protein